MSTAAATTLPSSLPSRSIATTPTVQPSSTPSPAPTSTATATPVRTQALSPTPSPTPSLPPPPTPSTGKPLPFSLDWRLDANGHLTESAVMQRDGSSLFLLTSLGRRVYALNSSGELVWRFRTDGPAYALAPLGPDRVAVGDDAGIVSLLDLGGRELWRHDLGSRVTALHGGWESGVLAGGWDEHLSFLDERGQVQWQYDLGGPLSDIAMLPDLAVAATLDGHVRGIDPAGSDMWLFDTGSSVTSLDILDTAGGTRILVGVQDGRLTALDSAGAIRWQHTIGSGGPVWHIADIVNDASPEILVGTGESEPLLVLLSPEGQTIWRIAIASPVGAITSVDLDGDDTPEIMVGMANGEVQAYDSQGHLRGAVHAGLHVWGLQATGDGSALVLADTAAWLLVGQDGPSGGPWLPPPALVPIRAESSTAEHESGTERAILVFLGDVAPGRSMEAQLARYGPAYPWTGLGSLLDQADLAVANLECVLTSRGKPLDKSYLIRAHPRWALTLVEADIDLVTLANNHALDYGTAGLDDTLSTVQALGIAAVGAGASREAAHQPTFWSLNGVEVAVLGYAAARWNGSPDVPATNRLAWAEPSTVQADVQGVRGQVDVVVILLHAGTEYAATPSVDQVEVARAAIDAGADLVVGHHSHVAQAVERYGQGLIVYGLGDALFDIPRSEAMKGNLLRVRVTSAGLDQAELWPFWIEHSIRPRLLDDGDGEPRFKIVYP